MSWLEAHWYRKTPVSFLLLPVSWVYCLAALVRRGLYRVGLKHVTRLSVPVIVVGNLTVGGTGKTPLVLWLARLLQQRGYKPGLVSRGYGGRSAQWPVHVSARSEPGQVGDEPVLLARNCTCPLMVGPDRVAAAQQLVGEHGCDVVVSDDGLQHYAMARNIEIAVIDGMRRLGNGYCLPAGPLREPLTRLRTVHARVTHGQPRPGEFAMQLAPIGFKCVGVDREQPIGAFAGQRVHAVAGIGHPARFFQQLRELGIDVVEHPFPDHHNFRASDLQFADELPVIMTEKDAVKCERFADKRVWYLAAEADLDPALGDLVLGLLEKMGSK